jgi:acyl carrier protein
MTELKTKLKEMIIRDLKITSVTPEEIQDDGPLFGAESQLGLDSLDAVELVVLVQKNFGVEIGDRNTASAAFASIDELAEYITKNQPRT